MGSLSNHPIVSMIDISNVGGHWKFAIHIVYSRQYETLKICCRKSTSVIDIWFIWIRVAVSKLVITVDWFSAYRNRKAVQNALHINISHHC